MLFFTLITMVITYSILVGPTTTQPLLTTTQASFAPPSEHKSAETLHLMQCCYTLVKKVATTQIILSTSLAAYVLHKLNRCTLSLGFKQLYYTRQVLCTTSTATTHSIFTALFQARVSARKKTTQCILCGLVGTWEGWSFWSGQV